MPDARVASSAQITEQKTKTMVWWRRYWQAIDKKSLIEWFQQGSWYLLFWSAILEWGNKIRTASKAVGPLTISLQSIEPKYGQGFFSNLGKISQKTLNILLPIGYAFMVLGLLAESFGFYKTKNKNLQKSAKLTSSWISGSLVLAAVLTTGSIAAPWLFFAAVAVKLFECFVETVLSAIQCSTTGKIRPLLHNTLSLAASVLTLTTLYYLIVVSVSLAAVATGPAGIAAIGVIAGTYLLASKLALAASILMLCSLAVKGIDELIIKPYQKIREEDELELSHQQALNATDSPSISPSTEKPKSKIFSFYKQEERVKTIKKHYAANQLTEAKQFLISQIETKIHSLNEPNRPISTLKSVFLTQLKDKLNENYAPLELKAEIKEILKSKEFKGVLQSTFRAIGDVEDIVIATMCYLRLEEQESKLTPTLDASLEEEIARNQPQ